MADVDLDLIERSVVAELAVEPKSLELDCFVEIGRVVEVDRRLVEVDFDHLLHRSRSADPEPADCSVHSQVGPVRFEL